MVMIKLTEEADKYLKDVIESEGEIALAIANYIRVWKRMELIDGDIMERAIKATEKITRGLYL